jgi:hypothetical protein
MSIKLISKHPLVAAAAAAVGLVVMVKNRTIRLGERVVNLKDGHGFVRDDEVHPGAPTPPAGGAK